MFFASKFKLVIGVLLLMPALSIAAKPRPPVNYAFLKHGFNLQAYNICDQQLKKCPKAQGRPDGFLAEACVKKVVNSTPDCNQLNTLAEKIHGTLGFVRAKVAADNFAIITQIYPADGQENHYIISPQGYLLETNIDPRGVDINLKKQYEKADFYPKTNGDVETETSSHTIHFTVPLLITNTCSTCEVIGEAKVQFNFSKQGKPMKTRLVSFREENK